MIKYKYVKITLPNNDVVYAYERSVFWVFKKYLDLQDAPRMNWRNLHSSIGEFRYYLVHKDLSQVKKAVQICWDRAKKPTIKIEDAETKLDKHLSGE